MKLVNIIDSIKKSIKIKKLQKIISPPFKSTKNVEQMAADIYSEFLANSSSDEALEQFLDLCISDREIKNICLEYSLSRNDLKDIYNNLTISGAGAWIKKHYVPLSTIAYSEPLLIYLEAKNKCISDMKVAYNLLEYWKGNKI